MSIDYSQFYVGTSSINSYGNSAYKKDTLVKYEFNTTDKYGNKIMDKMSREETIQAMNDIRSQYGDNVIVEFSGDGMAALVENRKGQVDEAITDEQREAKAERDAAFANEIIQNEHREVAPEHMESKLDYVKIMHEKSPETASKVDDYIREFSKTKDKSYIEKAAKLCLDWFKESYIQHKEWFAAKEGSKAAASVASAGSQPKLSSKAQKLLDELSAKYGNINFLVGDYGNVKELMRSSGKEYSVLLTAEELEKMASDDDYKEKMLDKAGRLIDFSKRINGKYGFTSAGGSVTGGITSRYGLAMEDDGTVTLFAELMNRAKDKKVLLQASSENELLNMIEQLDWSGAGTDHKIIFKEDFGGM